MFETIGILIVFFILLGIGVAIYFNVQKASNQRELVRQQQLQAFAQSQKLLYLPELDCTFYKTTTDTCFEKIKINALKTILTTETALIDYFSTFGYSTIKINIIYPYSETITLYEHTPKKIKQITATQLPVLILNTIDDTKAFAYMDVVNYVSE